jgi:hypothetical protein
VQYEMYSNFEQKTCLFLAWLCVPSWILSLGLVVFLVCALLCLAGNISALSENVNCDMRLLSFRLWPV